MFEYHPDYYHRVIFRSNGEIDEFVHLLRTPHIIWKAQINRYYTSGILLSILKQRVAGSTTRWGIFRILVSINIEILIAIEIGIAIDCDSDTNFDSSEIKDVQR